MSLFVIFFFSLFKWWENPWVLGHLMPRGTSPRKSAHHSTLPTCCALVPWYIPWFFFLFPFLFLHFILRSLVVWLFSVVPWFSCSLVHWHCDSLAIFLCLLLFPCLGGLLGKGGGRVFWRMFHYFFPISAVGHQKCLQRNCKGGLEKFTENI